MPNPEGRSGTGKKLKLLLSCAYRHIPFCFSSVNQILPFESDLTSHVCEISVGFERLSQTGIINYWLLLSLIFNLPRWPNFEDTYHIESLSARMPSGISHFWESEYSEMKELLCWVEFIPQNCVWNRKIAWSFEAFSNWENWSDWANRLLFSLKLKPTTMNTIVMASIKQRNSALALVWVLNIL